MKNTALRTSRNVFTVISLAMMYAAPALAGGMAEDDANGFLSWLKVIVPPFFIISLIILGLLYSKKIIGKDGLINWFIGIFIASAASELVALLWHN